MSPKLCHQTLLFGACSQTESHPLKRSKTGDSFERELNTLERKPQYWIMWATETLESSWNCKSRVGFVVTGLGWVRWSIHYFPEAEQVVYLRSEKRGLEKWEGYVIKPAASVEHWRPVSRGCSEWSHLAGDRVGVFMHQFPLFLSECVCQQTGMLIVRHTEPALQALQWGQGHESPEAKHCSWRLEVKLVRPE